MTNHDVISSDYDRSSLFSLSFLLSFIVCKTILLLCLHRYFFPFFWLTYLLWKKSYPVILSFENHASPPQQIRMVEILRSTFGKEGKDIEEAREKKKKNAKPKQESRRKDMKKKRRFPSSFVFLNNLSLSLSLFCPGDMLAIPQNDKQTLPSPQDMMGKILIKVPWSSTHMERNSSTSYIPSFFHDPWMASHPLHLL